jgi:hypothetical protein
MKKSAVLVLALGLISTAALAGPKWELGDDSWMKLSFLGQPHFSYNPDGADKEDFYLRRGRIILAGQIMDGVKFFVETDNDNAGKRGVSSSTDIQDAFVDLRVYGDHWLEAGLVLLPFSFETKSSAASLLGIDYNAEVVKLANTFVWRDYGAELHGNFGSTVAYRVGLFDGYDNDSGIKNSGAGLRVCGHVAVNLLGKVETGWFLGQSRLGKAGDYLTVGAGMDYQKDATVVTPEVVLPAGGGLLAVAAAPIVEDNEAWVVDLQSGMDLGAVGLTVNAALYDWDNAVYKGNTAFVEAGVLIQKTMITAKYSVQDPNNGDATEDYTAGIHYFMKGHNIRGGLEARWGDSDDMYLLGLQFLL